MSDAKDRNGCHPDCGKTQREHALSEHDSMEPGWAMNIASERIYCTAACRDARPIPAPEPAKPQHPERRAGQTWRCNGGPAFTLLKRHDYVSREAWCADDGQGWVGWDIPGCMTLIADAPAQPPVDNDHVAPGAEPFSDEDQPMDDSFAEDC